MLKTTVAAAVIGAFSLGIAMPTAGAITPNPSPIMGSSIEPAAYVVKKKVVKTGHKKKVWVYSSSKHGPRYRAKRSGYAYYYGGYYYSRPWWTICIGC
jgi:hypothetical protein